MFSRARRLLYKRLTALQPPAVSTPPQVPAKSCRVKGISSSHARFYHSTKPKSALVVRTASTASSPPHSASPIDIPIDGVHHKFSPLLLRDLCQCPRCVHETTKQKLYSTADIPTEINARTVNMSDNDPTTVSISWANDAPGFGDSHETKLSSNILREIAKSGVLLGPFRAPLGSHQIWDKQSRDSPDVDYHAYMDDDQTLYQAMCQLQRNGLLFIKNVPAIEKSVSTIAERIGPVKDTFYGHTWDVRSVPAAINAAYTSQDLGFHTDLLYTQNPPHIQFLHCIQSSSTGGASVFADAYKSAVDLYTSDQNAFNVLASTPVNYHYNHPDSNLYFATKPVLDLRPLRVGNRTYNTLAEFLQAWNDRRAEINKVRSPGAMIPQLNVVDCIEKINWGPPFLAPFSLQENSLEQVNFDIDTTDQSLNLKIAKWHAAAKKFSALLHRPETMHERLMKPGECVLFDNTGILHGRKAFDTADAGKARWLRGTYVDKDPYLSKLRVLKHKFDAVHDIGSA